VHVATDLGLRPSGVREGGRALLDLGLADRLACGDVHRLDAPAFDPAVDARWGVPNMPAAAALAVRQADCVRQILDAGDFPLVLGGDDSVVFGCLLAMRRREAECGLYLLDGHTDFWDPRRGDGELSDSDLFLVTGRGPRVLSDLEQRGPLVSDRNCVVYGHRDRADQLARGSDDVYATTMLVRSLSELRAAGMRDAGRHAVARLEPLGSRRVWVHLDADCLDDRVMPAVDWRLPDGLAPAEVVELLDPLLASDVVAGMDVTIYNPALDDPDRSAGRVLADLLADLLGDGRRRDGIGPVAGGLPSPYGLS